MPAASYQEEIEVGRVVLDARPVDRHGRLIRGLGPTDFSVHVEGEPAEIVSVEWMGDEPATGRPARTTERTEQRLARRAATGGRTIILFFQRDLVPSRIAGLMKALPEAERFVDSLNPGDRVAIFVYDSHLRLHADFSNDAKHLRSVLRDTVVKYARPSPRQNAFSPSVFPGFDPDAARSVANPEDALALVARSVEHIPGPKSMLFFCWGLGRLVGGAVQMGRGYGSALRALRAARIAVFSLDVAQADYHTLEGPLERVAWDTGGFYRKTHHSTIFAVDSVMDAISGHYEITFKRPELALGAHALRVRLVGRKGNVYHKPFYVESRSAR